MGETELVLTEFNNSLDRSEVRPLPAAGLSETDSLGPARSANFRFGFVDTYFLGTDLDRPFIFLAKNTRNFFTTFHFYLSVFQ